MTVTAVGSAGRVVRLVSPKPRRLLLSTPVLAWLTHLTVVLATATITVALTPDRDAKRPRVAGIGHYLVSPLASWDGGWYVRIAQQGYGHRQMTAAFWPLYPLLLRFGHAVTGAPYAVAGVVLSTVCFLGALVVMFDLVRKDYGDAVAKRTVWLTALCPLAFFFSAVYTESIFLLLTVVAIACGRANRWTCAALAAALAALTRSSGVLVLVPLGWMLIAERGWHPRGWWRQGGQLAAAGAAPLAFAWFLYRLRGDPLLMLHVQSRWGRVFGWPWETLATGFRISGHVYLGARHACALTLDVGALDRCRVALQVTRSNAVSHHVAFVVVFGCLALLPFAVWRLQPRDSLYLVVGFLLPLWGPQIEDPLQSTARYLVVLFPAFVALAMLLRWPVVVVAALVASTVALCGLLSLFAQVFFVA
jgi:hypothetical protein